MHYSRVGPGDFVLLTAATGSVGLAAIQIAKAQRATVIATTRSAGKRDALRGLGAYHVIITGQENLPDRVREITGGKLARVVFDPVGGDSIHDLAQATAANGSIYLYGAPSGRPTLVPPAIFGRNIGLYGYSVTELAKDAARLDAMKRLVFTGLAGGSLRPHTWSGLAGG